MATALQTLIDAYIKRNANQEITGPVLNGVLSAIADALGTPFIGDDGYWYTYDPETGQFIQTDTPAQGETGPVGVTEAAATIDANIGTPSVAVSLNGTRLDFAFHNLKGQKGDQGTAGITAAVVTVDGNTGTPSVDASISGTTLTLAFHNLKGEQGVRGEQGIQGIQGPTGPTGAAGGFGTPTISVGANQGTPSASVTASGPDTAKVFAFAFDGLKGETGPQGIQGPQGNPGSSVDYPFTLANNLTTDDPDVALTAAMGVQLEGEISQLSQELYGESETIITETQYANPGFIAYSGGAITNTGSSWIHSDIIPLADFVEAGQITPHGSVAGVAFYNGTSFSDYISGINYPTIDDYLVDRKITKEAISSIIPANATHIAFSTDSSQYTLKVKTQTIITSDGLVETVADLEDKIDNDIEPRLKAVEDDINGVESPTPEQTQYSEAGYIKMTDGSIVTGNTWIHSPFIPINDFISAQGFIYNGSVASAAFYSAEDRSSFISGYQVAAGYQHLTINKADLTIPAGALYISLSTNGATDTLVVTTATVIKGLKERVADLENEEHPAGLSTKCLHFSFDDTISAFYDIAHNNRASIFDNAFFGALKTLHDTYGCVFSCYCFLDYFNLKWVSKLSTIANPDTTAVYFLGSADGQYAANTWYVYRNSAWTEFTDALRSEYAIFSLSDMPATYAAEFSASSEWLKFGLHGRDGMVNYQSATAEEATTDYNLFITTIVGITGTVECIDTVVRLQNFAGNANVIRALRDADLGIQGLLCSDYSETSGGSGGSSGGYIVSNALAVAVWKKGQIYDYAERLHFYVSGLRIDNTTSANMPAYMAKFLTPAKWEQTAMVEMYCHENQMYNPANNTITSDYIARFESVCIWAVANDFSFCYQMDKIRMAF